MYFLGYFILDTLDRWVSEKRVVELEIFEVEYQNMALLTWDTCEEQRNR